MIANHFSKMAGMYRKIFMFIVVFICVLSVSASEEIQQLKFAVATREGIKYLSDEEAGDLTTNRITSASLDSTNTAVETVLSEIVEEEDDEKEPIVIPKPEDPTTNNVQISGIELKPVTETYSTEMLQFPEASFMAAGCKVQSRMWSDGGKEEKVENSYISLASGMYCKSIDDRWTEAEIVADATADGSLLFSKIPVVRRFAADCAQESVLESDHDGVSGCSAVAGLSYYDTSSGKSVLIATMKPSQVQEHSSGAFYAQAFDGVDADIVYKLHNWGIEQDVVVYGDLPHPSVYGFEEKTTWLCVLTELVDADLSELTVTRNGRALPAERSTAPLQIYKDKKRLYNFQQGYAYTAEDSKSTALVLGGEDVKERSLVHMRMFTANKRVFISEEIPLPNLVKGMPSVYATAEQVSDLNAPQIDAVQIGDPIPPERPGNSRDLLVEEGGDEPPVRQISDEDTANDVMASLITPYEARGHHYVIDYIDRSGSITNDLVFETGETYYIKDEGLFLSGATLTLEPGCIVLFTNTAKIALEDDAQIVCESHAVSPALFTTACDTNHGGDFIYSGTPKDNLFETAFELENGSYNLRGIEVRFAQQGLLVETNDSSTTLVLQDAQFHHCSTGLVIDAQNATATVINVLFDDAACAVSSAGNELNVQNATITDINGNGIDARSTGSLVELKDTLLVGVTNVFQTNTGVVVAFDHNGTWNTGGFAGSNGVPLASNPFVSGTYGDFYLYQTNALINGGSQDADDSGLYHFTTATAGGKETNSVVDIGFHYPASVTDNDSDNLIAIFEDTNGDGVYNSTNDVSNWDDPDTDDDGMWDGWEFSYGFDPQDNSDGTADADGDGLSNAGEYTASTDPYNTDTDGDGMNDGFEVDNGFDPLLGGSDGVVGLWDFDENSGTTVYDESGEGNNASLMYMAGNEWCDGIISNSLRFDGTNDYGQLSDTSILRPSRSISISAWICPNKNYGGTESFNIFSRDQPGSAYGYSLRYIEGSLDFLMGDGQYREIRVSTNLESGVWYHVVGVFDGTNHQLYLDNKLLKQFYRPITIRYQSITPRMGASCNSIPVAYFQGCIDTVRVYPYGLNSNEIAAIYELGADKDSDGLSNKDEALWGSDANDTDSDDDGLNDGDEVHLYDCNPMETDTDNDDLDDGDEVNIYSTDPADPDTDGDGANDGLEVSVGTDPLDDQSFPVSISGTITADGYPGNVYIEVAPMIDTNDLKLYYAFDTQETNTVVDISGNSWTGTVNGAVYATNGIRSGAWYFNGSSYIWIGNMGNTPTGTISFWVNADVLDAHRNPFASEYCGDDCIRFETTPEDWLYAAVSEDSGILWGAAFYSQSLLESNWYHVVMTWDDSSKHMWGSLNGEEVYEYTYNSLYLDFPSTVLGYGQSYAPNRLWKGLIDEVRIYTKELDPTAVAAEYMLLTGKGCSTTVLASAGAYTVSNLPNNCQYRIIAWRDSDTNNVRDSYEGCTEYTNLPLTLVCDTNNIDIEIVHPDTDGDGIPDWWEVQRNTAVNFDDTGWDWDNDGLTVELEYLNNSDPNSNDTDGDGMPDGWEVAHCLQPDVYDGNTDSDGDGVANTQEYANGTHPMEYIHSFTNIALAGGFGDYPWSTTENPMFLVSNHTWCAYVDWQAHETNSFKFIANAHEGWTSNLPEWAMANTLVITQFSCPVISQEIRKGSSPDDMIDIQVETGTNTGPFCVTLYPLDNTFSLEPIDEIPPYNSLCSTYRVPGSFNDWSYDGTNNLMHELKNDQYIYYQEIFDTTHNRFKFSENQSAIVVWGDNQQTSIVPPIQESAELGYDKTNILFYSSPPGLYEITFNNSNYAYGVKYVDTDQDNDGLTDMQEVMDYSCDPLIVDTDGDGMSDGDEVDRNFDPATYNAAATVEITFPFSN